jgi:hypothetical protein
MDGLDVSPETLLWTAASLWAVFVLTSAPGRSQLANVFSKVLPPFPRLLPPPAVRTHKHSHARRLITLLITGAAGRLCGGASAAEQRSQVEEERRAQPGRRT